MIHPTKEREKRYNYAMSLAGFRQVTLWIHESDEENIRRTAERTREDMREAELRMRISALTSHDLVAKTIEELK